MKNKLSGLVIVVVVFLSFASSNLNLAGLTDQAQKQHEMLSAGARARIIQQLKTDVSQLASSPRFSTEQYSRAVAYVRSQTRAAGLEAVIEPVEGVSQWERGDSDRGDLLLPNGETVNLRMVSLTGSAGGEVEGEVVLVNYFFDRNQGPPPRRFDEGNKKRIVFFARPLPRDRSPNGYINTVVQRNFGAIWAARYGAAGVLVRSVQTGDGPQHAGAVAYADDAPRIPAAALSVDDADKLEKLLCHGTVGREQNSKLCDGKASVRLRIMPKHADRQQANVVIRVPGTTLSKEIILVGAHLDSHDVTPGAADDAAGVAAALAVMREFAKRPPARTILIVLFADEELGGAGSNAFVNHHVAELSQIVAATELDDGDGPPRGLQITSSDSQSAIALASLRKLADRVGAETTGLELRRDTVTNAADISPLWEQHGIPEIAILQDFTKYFDKHHAPNDTPENIDLDGLSRTTFLLIRLVYELSFSAPPPKHRKDSTR